MDGNARWARARGLGVKAGHKAGVDALRAVVEGLEGLGVGVLAVYGFSEENWGRPRGEVEGLMDLAREYLSEETEELRRRGVRVRMVGRREGLARDVRELVEDAERITRDCERYLLTVAFGHGGRQDVVGAAREAMRRYERGELSGEDMDEGVFGGLLESGFIESLDVIIRTGGEKRLSNFMLWQASYAELVFTDVLWPDFGAEDFALALEEFSARERRYGLRG